MFTILLVLHLPSFICAEKGLERENKYAGKLLSGEENEPQNKKSFTISSLQEKGERELFQ